MRAASLRLLAAVLLLELCAACGSARSTEPRPRADRDLLTHDQLAKHNFNTAYDAVEALRRNWLTTRGADSFNTPTPVWVYFDNVRLGGTESLRGIATNSILWIRYFDGVAATSRWGIGHGQGVIFVSTH